MFLTEIFNGSRTQLKERIIENKKNLKNPCLFVILDVKLRESWIKQVHELGLINFLHKIFYASRLIIFCLLFSVLYWSAFFFNHKSLSKVVFSYTD